VQLQYQKKEKKDFEKRKKKKISTGMKIEGERIVVVVIISSLPPGPSSS